MSDFAVDSSDDVAGVPALRELATRLGVATEYWDWRGNRTPVTVRTVVAVLRAFGRDLTCMEDVKEALAEVESAPWRRVLPAIVTGRQGQPACVVVHVPHGSTVAVEVRTEAGAVVHGTPLDYDAESRDIDGVTMEQAAFELPADLPLGYHEVRAWLADAVHTCPLVVAPATLSWPAGITKQQSWGLMAQLYSVRSHRSWGIGDFADLADLGQYGADLGADFLLINPIHAAQPVPPIEDSPYLPTTRRFVNPLYIRVEGIEETAYLIGKDAARVARRGDRVRAGAEQTELMNNEPVALLDRQLAWKHKLKALRSVYHVPRGLARQASFEHFLAREGKGLRQFGFWCALNEKLRTAASWPDWALDPSSAEIAALEADLEEGIGFHCWMQWIADEQLAAAQQAMRVAGMSIGLVTDLAVGVHPTGADVWSLGSTMATGVSVGAPPDAFNQRGQNWSQPPWRPDMLAQRAYRPYRDMLRSALRHAGGLRIDHVMGLFRLWCIPDGLEPGDGAYLRYDHEVMVSILLLEAERAGAFVVGEDLGVVEPFVREYLAERGILGTSILWFERDDAGPRPPETLRELNLATVATHDLPPTAGYLAGEHIRLRDRLGLLTRPVEEELRIDQAEQRSVLELLVARGLITADAGEEDVVMALHLLLTAGPSRLIGVMLSDLLGDKRTQNQPGTFLEYPNWRMPLADNEGRIVHIEDLPGNARAARLADRLNGATSA